MVDHLITISDRIGDKRDNRSHFLPGLRGRASLLARKANATGGVFRSINLLFGDVFTDDNDFGVFRVSLIYQDYRTLGYRRRISCSKRTMADWLCLIPEILPFPC